MVCGRGWGCGSLQITAAGGEQWLMVLPKVSRRHTAAWKPLRQEGNLGVNNDDSRYQLVLVGQGRCCCVSIFPFCFGELFWTCVLVASWRFQVLLGLLWLQVICHIYWQRTRMPVDCV